jgi:hypothetical protein
MDEEGAMSPDVISRKSARAVGQTFYFAGKPCKHGHVAKRRSHNGECMVCGRKYQNEWRNTRRPSLKTHPRAS